MGTVGPSHPIRREAPAQAAAQAALVRTTKRGGGGGRRSTLALTNQRWRRQWRRYQHAANPRLVHLYCRMPLPPEPTRMHWSRGRMGSRPLVDPDGGGGHHPRAGAGERSRDDGLDDSPRTSNATGASGCVIVSCGGGCGGAVAQQPVLPRTRRCRMPGGPGHGGCSRKIVVYTSGVRCCSCCVA